MVVGALALASLSRQAQNANAKVEKSETSSRWRPGCIYPAHLSGSFMGHATIWFETFDHDLSSADQRIFASFFVDVSECLLH